MDPEPDPTFKTLVKQLLSGTISKYYYMRYMALVLGIYFIGIIVSAAVFPGGFSMQTVYVSYLGGYPNNPNGYQFYNTCVIITGILLVPNFLYMYRRLQPAFKFLNVIACIFGIIGSLGYSSLGIYHQGVEGSGHQVTTYLAFGGLGVSAFFMLWVFIRKMCLKQGWPKLGQLIFVYGQIFVIIGVITLFTGYSELFDAYDIDPAYFKDRFWEWFYVFIFVIWVIGIVFMTPADWKPAQTPKEQQKQQPPAQPTARSEESNTTLSSENMNTTLSHPDSANEQTTRGPKQ